MEIGFKHLTGSNRAILRTIIFRQLPICEQTSFVKSFRPPVFQFMKRVFAVVANEGFRKASYRSNLEQKDYL